MKEQDRRTFVLHTFSGGEFRLFEFLHSGILQRSETIWFPQVEYRRNYQGIEKQIRKPLFPGYVFVESGDESGLFYRIRNHRTTQFIRLLREAAGILELPHEEETWIRKFCDEEWIVQGSVGEIIDGKLHVISGPLAGLENRVEYISRHKKYAIVRLTLLGEEREVKVGLEVVRKV